MTINYSSKATGEISAQEKSDVELCPIKMSLLIVREHLAPRIATYELEFILLGSEK